MTDSRSPFSTSAPRPKAVDDSSDTQPGSGVFDEPGDDSGDHDVEDGDELDEILDQLAQGRTSRLSRENEGLASTVEEDWGLTTPIASEETTDRDFEPLATRAVTGRRKLIVPRPGVLIRILVVGVLVLLAGLTLMAGLTAQVVGELVERIDRARNGIAVVDLPAPPTGDLLRPNRFQEPVRERPHQASDLHFWRAQALADEGRPVPAARHFEQARLHATHTQGVDRLLAYVAVLLVLDRYDQVVALLRNVDLDRVDAPTRQRIISLYGRLHAARRSDPSLPDR